MSDTEGISSEFKNFHNLDELAQTKLLLKDYNDISSIMYGAQDEIVSGMQLITTTWENGKRIQFSGAGTSGRLGILKSAAITAQNNLVMDSITAHIAGGEQAMFTTGEGAEDKLRDGFNATKLQKDDLLIALSASGTAHYVHGSIMRANMSQARTLTITCNYNNLLAEQKNSIIVPTGAEFPHGGTRKKAGQAQKLLLDLLLLPTSHECTNKKQANQLFEEYMGKYQNMQHIVESQVHSINTATNKLTEIYENGGRLFFIGAGAAGKLGVIQSSECASTFNTPTGKIESILEGGNQAMFTFMEEHTSSYEEGFRVIKSNIQENDAVIVLSTTGNSPYAQGASDASLMSGAYTVGLVARKNECFANSVDTTIVTPIESSLCKYSLEDLAQKMVLDTITTHMHEKLGRIYQGEMVCFKGWLSKKLKSRAQRVVARISHIENTYAQELLERTNYHIPEALVMAQKNSTLAEAQKLLTKVDYNLHKLL